MTDRRTKPTPPEGMEKNEGAGAYRVHHPNSDVVPASQKPATLRLKPVKSGKSTGTPAPAAGDSSRSSERARIASDPALRIGAQYRRPSRPSFPAANAEAVDLETLVRELASADRERARVLTRRLAGLAKSALPVLVCYFPGRRWAAAEAHIGRDIGPIAQAMAALGERAAPFVVSLLDSQTATTRQAALCLAADLPYPDVVSAIAQRLFDIDGRTQMLSLDVLCHIRHHGCLAHSLAWLRQIAADEGEITHRLTAMRALTVLRDALALRLFADLMPEPTLGQAAHGALVLLSGTDLGTDPADWRRWLDS